MRSYIYKRFVVILSVIIFYLQPPAKHTIEKPFKATVPATATFTVYADSESPCPKDPIDENNIIHLLERKCKEEQLQVTFLYVTNI